MQYKIGKTEYNLEKHLCNDCYWSCKQDKKLDIAKCPKFKERRKGLYSSRL